MWWLIPSVFVGWGTGLAIIIWAFVAVRASLSPSEPDEGLLRAFKALESDFEESEERVKSALGRVSRLKREILPVRGASGDGPEANAGASPSPLQRLTRSQLLARSKSRGGDFDYADEQNVTSPAPGRRTD